MFNESSHNLIALALVCATIVIVTIVLSTNQVKEIEAIKDHRAMCYYQAQKAMVDVANKKQLFESCSKE